MYSFRRIVTDVHISISARHTAKYLIPTPNNLQIKPALFIQMT